MNDEQPHAPPEQKTGRVRNLIVVLAGIVLAQFILYGPSLVGWKILLPIDLLTGPGVYIPRAADAPIESYDNSVLSDLTYSAEPARRFAVSEIQAGRFPMWAPYHFAGAPFVWPKFSPFMFLESCVASPIILAWVQLLVAMVAGVGAYLFFRRTLDVGQWPATIVAWCYPITGFFALWQGYALVTVVCWLPWLLLAVHRTVRRPDAVSLIGLSVLTGLVLVSGQLDLAGQVLLSSGLYALWRLWDAHRPNWFSRPVVRAVLILMLGWGLGFLLAAPHLLPLLEYTRTGSRMTERFTGKEERPPVGLAALPQVVLPEMYGSTQTRTVQLFPAGQASLQEGSSAAYAGALATLVLAPLAWCSRRHFSANVFWGLLAVFALSWCLDLPAFVDLLRLPGLNMMSHNRLVFAAAFAFLAMSAVGLEVLLREPLQWRSWMWLPAGILVWLFAWCVYQAVVLPEALPKTFQMIAQQENRTISAPQIERLRVAPTWFALHYAVAAGWCGAGAVGWLLLRFRRSWQDRLVPAFALVLFGELLWFAWGKSPQCARELYYPPIPVLQEVAKATPGRVIGFTCLPASIAVMSGLRDIRGYDAVDPARLVQLVSKTGSEKVEDFPYALTQVLVPTLLAVNPPSEVRLSPILDMLGVRYVIFRKTPPPQLQPEFQGPDYWVLVNPVALPRAFVPRRAECVADDATRFQELTASDFKPRDVAYVETPVSLPSECRGTAEIVSEIPTRLKLAVKMETAGLVVLADLWDAGWHATLDGKPVPILRANHAIRGVVVPAGDSTLEFRYWPASFTVGLRLAGLGLMVLFVVAAATVLKKRKISPANAAS